MNLTRETIQPTDREHWLDLRRADLTSTDVATLFGYGSLFSLWHRKHRGAPDVVEENESMRWGKRLEKPIAYGLAEDNGFEIEPMPEYMRLPEHRIGSSFDFRAKDRSFVFEIKDVGEMAFRDKFIDADGFIEAPPRIELQVATQMLVGDFNEARIGVLVGRRGRILVRANYEDVCAAILRAASEFWIMPEPAPDFFADEDRATIGAIYNYSSDKTIDADPELEALFREYAGYKADAREAEKQAEAKRAEILILIADASRVNFSDGGYALTKTQPAVEVAAFVRKASRPIRVYNRGDSK